MLMVARFSESVAPKGDGTTHQDPIDVIDGESESLRVWEFGKSWTFLLMGGPGK